MLRLEFNGEFAHELLFNGVNIKLVVVFFDHQHTVISEQIKNVTGETLLEQAVASA